jgi:hypothetical protein
VASGLTGLRVVPSAPGAVLDGRDLGREPITLAGGDELTVTTPPP